MLPYNFIKILIFLLIASRSRCDTRKDFRADRLCFYSELCHLLAIWCFQTSISFFCTTMGIIMWDYLVDLLKCLEVGYIQYHTWHWYYRCKLKNTIYTTTSLLCLIFSSSLILTPVLLNEMLIAKYYPHLQTSTQTIRMFSTCIFSLTLYVCRSLLSSISNFTLWGIPFCSYCPHSTQITFFPLFGLISHIIFLIQGHSLPPSTTNIHTLMGSAGSLRRKGKKKSTN